jgi:hypothetical protein
LLGINFNIFKPQKLHDLGTSNCFLNLRHHEVGFWPLFLAFLDIFEEEDKFFFRLVQVKNFNVDWIGG